MPVHSICVRPAATTNAKCSFAANMWPRQYKASIAKTTFGVRAETVEDVE